MLTRFSIRHIEPLLTTAQTIALGQAIETDTASVMLSVLVTRATVTVSDSSLYPLVLADSPVYSVAVSDASAYRLTVTDSAL